MRTQGGIFSGSSMAMIAVVLLSGVASAEEESRTDQRWIPSLALVTAGMPEHRKASADSSVSGFQDGESVGFPWSIGGDVALASPVLGTSKLKPRAVIHAGAGYVVDGNDPVSTKGDPGNPPILNPFQPDPLSIENQGSAVKGQAKPWVLTGGIGAIVEFEAFERRFFIRPSLEWMYRKDTIQAILGSAEAEALDVNGNCAPCRTLFIDAETEKGYHSLGVGLESGIDGGRIGDFLVRFFATGGVYHILGDRKTAISPTATWTRTDGLPTNRPNPQTTYNIEYEREAVHYRFGVGMQLLWQPE